MAEDVILHCRECGRTFVFTGAEQDFYAEKGFSKWPNRCKDCRRAVGQVYTGVCAACGREARVPFPPAEDRLVYCRDCFAQMTAERRELRALRERERERAGEPGKKIEKN